MIKTLLYLSVLLAPAASFAVVINFDDIPTSSSANSIWQGNRYLSQNVLFSTDGTALGAFQYVDMPGKMVGGMDGATVGDFNKSIEAKFVSSTNVQVQLATNSLSFFIRNAGSSTS